MPRLHTAPTPLLDWLVVGGGPCGIMAVGLLLERQAAQQTDCRLIGWVDRDRFSSVGRLGDRYASVPANTRNDQLVAAFESIPAFEFEERQAVRGEEALIRQPRSETSLLGYSVDALRDASDAMRASGKLRVCWERACVAELTFGEDRVWEALVELDDDESDTRELRAKRVILATGATPKEPSPTLRAKLDEAGIRVIDHDDLVAPDRCAQFGAANPPKDALPSALGIVGGAHSGMLAAMNVLGEPVIGGDGDNDDDGAQHPPPPHPGVRRVVVYDRKPAPRFAEERDGWIKYDGTGLKGAVADWTRRALGPRPTDTGASSSTSKSAASPGGGDPRLQWVQVPDDRPKTDEERLFPVYLQEHERRLVARFRQDGIGAVAFTVGFEKRKGHGGLRECAYQRWPVDLHLVKKHNVRNGRLAPGLHGVGLGFPEHWIDYDGDIEPRVGFVLHFRDHLKRAIDGALWEPDLRDMPFPMD